MCVCARAGRNINGARALCARRAQAARNVSQRLQSGSSRPPLLGTRSRRRFVAPAALLRVRRPCGSCLKMQPPAPLSRRRRRRFRIFWPRAEDIKYCRLPNERAPNVLSFALWPSVVGSREELGLLACSVLRSKESEPAEANLRPAGRPASRGAHSAKVRPTRNSEAPLLSSFVLIKWIYINNCRRREASLRSSLSLARSLCCNSPVRPAERA